MQGQAVHDQALKLRANKRQAPHDDVTCMEGMQLCLAKCSSPAWRPCKPLCINIMLSIRCSCVGLHCAHVPHPVPPRTQPHVHKHQVAPFGVNIPDHILMLTWRPCTHAPTAMCPSTKSHAPTPFPHKDFSWHGDLTWAFQPPPAPQVAHIQISQGGQAVTDLDH